MVPVGARVMAVAVTCFMCGLSRFMVVLCCFCCMNDVLIWFLVLLRHTGTELPGGQKAVRHGSSVKVRLKKAVGVCTWQSFRGLLFVVRIVFYHFVV